MLTWVKQTTKYRFIKYPVALCRFCLVALLGLYAENTWAQSALPTTAEPGNIQRDYQNRQDLPISNSSPNLSTPLVVQAPPGAEKFKLTLKAITLSGNTVFSEDKLSPLYADLIGKTITLAEVYAVAQRITQLYQDAGYIFSVATLPPQEIKNGRVEIHITEAYLAALNLTGDNLDTALLSQFRTRALAQKPLNKNNLEEILLLLGNLPGVSITPVLIPGQTPGAITLDVNVTVKPYQVTAGLNNRNSRYTGPLRQNASATLFNLPHFASLKVAEETALPLKQLKILDATYTLPLNAYGDTLELGATSTRSQPGYTLKNFDVMSESDAFRLRWQTPLQLNALQNTRLQLGFEYTNAASTILDTPNSDDRLRVLEAALISNQRHLNGSITDLRLALRQGTNLFGASKPGRDYLSRANGRSDFTTLKLDLQYWQPLNMRWGIQAGLTGQYAGSQLLASEEFSWGGSNFGKGYDSGEFTGDHGLGTSLEVNYLIPPGFNSNTSHQLYAFTDLGTAWKIDNNQPDTRMSGMTAGFGLRSFFGNNVNTFIEIAKPLTRPNSSSSLSGNDPRLFAGFQLRY